MSKDSGGTSGSPWLDRAQQGWPGGARGFDPANLSSMLEQVLGQAADNPSSPSDAQHGRRPVRPGHQGGDARPARHLHGGPAVPDWRPRPRHRRRAQARPGQQGNDVHDAGAARAVADAVAVATLWLDEQSRRSPRPHGARPDSAAPSGSRRRCPAGSTSSSPCPTASPRATSDRDPQAARRARARGLRRRAATELQGMLGAGFDPAAMVEQWAPMLGNLSRQMFAAQLGQAVGTLATEVVGAHRGRACPSPSPASSPCCPATSTSSRTSLEIDLPQVRLYLAVREAARVRLFSRGAVARAAAAVGRRRLRPQHHHRHRRHRVGVVHHRRHRPRGPAQCPAGQPLPSAADPRPACAPWTRLETLLALAEGWVDHVTRPRHGRTPAPVGRARRDDPTPAGRWRRPEDLRRTRRARAAPAPDARCRQPLGRPRERRRRRRCATAGGPTPTSRPRRPTSTTPSASSSAPRAARASSPGDRRHRAGLTEQPRSVAPRCRLGTDLDSVLRGILEEADREREAGGEPRRSTTRCGSTAARRRKPTLTARDTRPRRTVHRRAGVTRRHTPSLRDDAIARLDGVDCARRGQERLRLDYLAHLATHPDAMARVGARRHT